MLPKIDVPIYSVKLLSLKDLVKFRPFTVKEEKLLLMASEAEDATATVDTIKQIMNNCVLSDIDMSKLPIYDFELLFLHIRARSVGEVVKLQYKCNNDIKDEEGDGTHKCDTLVKIDVNLMEIDFQNKEKANPKIEITDKMGIMMKHPSLDIYKAFTEELSGGDLIIKMTASCIDYIYDADQIYYAKDYTEQELIEFIDGLQSKDLEKIKEFFENMPRLAKDIDFKCHKCGYEEKMHLEGIDNFFV